MLTERSDIVESSAPWSRRFLSSRAVSLNDVVETVYLNSCSFRQSKLFTLVRPCWSHDLIVGFVREASTRLREGQLRIGFSCSVIHAKSKSLRFAWIGVKRYAFVKDRSFRCSNTFFGYILSVVMT
jgi:hypothetical protein